MKNSLESKIQAEILDAIGSEGDLLIFKNSVGKAKHVDESTGNVFYVPYGLIKDSPDLVGILKTSQWRFNKSTSSLEKHDVGMFYCLEVKQPGKQATPAQARCHDMFRFFGAFVAVVHSAEEAIDALNRARSGESS